MREPVASSLIVDFEMVCGVWVVPPGVLLGVYFLMSLCAEAEVARVCVEERRDWFYPGLPRALVFNWGFEGDTVEIVLLPPPT